MDSTTRRIVDYALSFSASDMTERVTTAALNHVVDTVAVAIAGYDSEQARIAAALARRVTAEQPATVIGFGVASSPDLAAFANTVMVRTYDWNDGMQAKGGGHPSDMIPGLLALGEITQVSGRDFLLSVALAYELLGGLGADVAIGDLGFDQGTLMGVATALAAGRLLGLGEDELANAASLALVPNVPLGVSRWGALSMMKGCATAFAVRGAVFAVQLAREGMSSAPAPFEGIYGLHHQTGPFEPRLPVLEGGPSVVEMSHQKPIPAETQALALLELVPRIRSFTPVDEIESILIELPDHAAEHIGDPPKYDPRTRETADHSLPYMLAVALVDGAITLDSYRPERFLDPDLRPLMRRIDIRAADDLSRMRHEEQYGVTRPAPARILVRATGGREFREEVAYYRGHLRNPMTRADIDDKFDRICDGLVKDARRDAIRAAWWSIGDAPDVAVPIGLLASLDGRS